MVADTFQITATPPEAAQRSQESDVSSLHADGLGLTFDPSPAAAINQPLQARTSCVYLGKQAISGYGEPVRAVVFQWSVTILDSLGLVLALLV